MMSSSFFTVIGSYLVQLFRQEIVASKFISRFSLIHTDLRRVQEWHK